MQDSPEIAYLQERRAKLGGYVPERRTTAKPLVLPGDKVYDVLKRGSGKQEIATTMAFVRLVRDLVKDPEIGHRIVPIIPDEARTFGMDSFFPTLKIYNPHGQLYTAVDASLMLAYKESEAGQILHEGIDEAGSVATLTAVSTSYATHGEPLIPIYIFYSMFGFQRTGDGFWAIGDQMGRGFVMGATAGRTTLTGEGLQHADGHSHLLAADACRTWSPTTRPTATRSPTSSRTACAGCTAAARSSRRARTSCTTSPSTTSPMCSRPSRPIWTSRVCSRACTCSRTAAETEGKARAQLLASGVGLRWALEAQQLLADDWDVAADVWSVTSWSELRPGGREDGAGPAARPEQHTEPYVTQKLQNAPGPVIATSDSQRAVQNLIAPWVPDRLRGAGRGRFRLLRHPGGGPAVLPHRRSVDGGGHPVGTGAARRVPRRRGGRGGREVPARRSRGPVRRGMRAANPEGAFPTLNRDRSAVTSVADSA